MEKGQKKEWFICGYLNGSMKSFEKLPTIEYMELRAKMEKKALKSWKQVKQFEKNLTK